MSRLSGGTMIDGDVGEEAIRRSSARASRARSGRKPTPPLARRVHDLVGVIEDLGDEPTPKAVHELRTTIRRVETLLAAGSDDAGVEHKVQKQLDRIRRKAGRVRDVDVHVKALRGVRRAVAPEALDEVREALKKARDKRQRKLTRTVGDARDRGLVKRLRRVIARAVTVPHRHADAVAVVTRVLGEFDGLVGGASPLGAANLHRLRIATKRLRYRVEPYEPDAAAAGVVRELKRVQDAIGVWHDWATLDERTVDVLGDEASPLVAAVRSRAAAELAKAIRATERVASRLRKVAGAPGGASGGREPEAATEPASARVRRDPRAVKPGVARLGATGASA